MTEKVRYGTPTGDGGYKYAYDKTRGKRYTRSKLLMEENAKQNMRKKRMLTGGQAKIAAKAPPPDKITGEDFAVLREEKKKVKPVKAALGLALGVLGAAGAKKFMKKKSTMKPGVTSATMPINLVEEFKKAKGLQNGGVMKAKMGVATDYKKYLKGLKKATDSVKKDKENKFIKRRMKLMGMPKLSKGGGFDAGTPGKVRDLMKQIKVKGKMFNANKLTEKDFEKLKKVKMSKIIKSDKYMGGGMMQKPMGYKSGKSIKVKCKLGKNKPTKMY